MSHALLACSVCFGQSDSPMAAGTNTGIFLMLGVTVAMLAAFAGFFFYLMRRARLADRPPAPPRPLQSRPDEGGRYVRPTEGTAQC